MPTRFSAVTSPKTWSPTANHGSHPPLDRILNQELPYLEGRRSCLSLWSISLFLMICDRWKVNDFNLADEAKYLDAWHDRSNTRGGIRKRQEDYTNLADVSVFKRNIDGPRPAPSTFTTEPGTDPPTMQNPRPLHERNPIGYQARSFKSLLTGFTRSFFPHLASALLFKHFSPSKSALFPISVWFSRKMHEHDPVVLFCVISS
jgi:hypothetical protein